MLESVDQAPPDLVLGITEAFKADTDPNKLNLGVGAYRTEELQPYVLNVVHTAEERMLAANENKEYLPIEGLASFREATVELLLGGDAKAVKENRVATLQALSGTGSLAVAAQFIHQFMPGKTVYISNPSWPNHKNIFALAGVPFDSYRYFDPKNIALDFDGMIEDIGNAPDGSIILLHGCAHNPTGIDPSKEQWGKIADVIERKGHMPFFDVAYQGFASGSLVEDAYAPRYFESRGMEVMVAQSYSKNLGLYAERVGALNIITKDADTTTRVMSQMKRLARAIWSNPPVHGARIVAEVVNNGDLFKEWEGEMELMSGRIKGVRKVLRENLEKLNPEKYVIASCCLCCLRCLRRLRCSCCVDGAPRGACLGDCFIAHWNRSCCRDWSFITSQIGMFTYTGCTPPQVENMTNKWHVYMTKDGRISLAGLSLSKCQWLAEAIDDSVRNH